MKRRAGRPGDREPYFQNYRLYPEEVVLIRLIRRAGVSTVEIAREMGISSSHVSNICHHRFWPELP